MKIPARIIAIFMAAKLTAKFVPSDEPQTTDDEIQIFRGGVDTRVTIQCGLNGFFYVNEYQGEGDDFVMFNRGEFCVLRRAVVQAIKTIAARASAVQ